LHSPHLSVRASRRALCASVRVSRCASRSFPRVGCAVQLSLNSTRLLLADLFLCFVEAVCCLSVPNDDLTMSVFVVTSDSLSESCLAFECLRLALTKVCDLCGVVDLVLLRDLAEFIVMTALSLHPNSRTMELRQRADIFTRFMERKCQRYSFQMGGSRRYYQLSASQTKDNITKELLETVDICEKRQRPGRNPSV
jgi:hypothetical protein